MLRFLTSRHVERAVWAAGIVCLLAFAGLRFGGTWSAARDVAAFRADGQSAPVEPRPDMSLWSPVRIQAWKDSHARTAPAALAVLRIPKIKLDVPVLEGTDDWTLNRAVGHIEDTARPGIAGNVGIAGHRDGFFRGLKDIVAGDALDLETAGRTTRYRVDHVWIVKPDDVWVIDPTPGAAITLVTCYPFYFVGSAPQRYIVRAVPVTPQ
ncbi:MAG TPA: class D sortase [Vicinamibacterales bacterium]|nr:class D sortase [Vicinamibacterales bacterium]